VSVASRWRGAHSGLVVLAVASMSHGGGACVCALPRVRSGQPGAELLGSGLIEPVPEGAQAGVNDAEGLDVGVPALAFPPTAADIGDVRTQRGRLLVGEFL